MRLLKRSAFVALLLGTFGSLASAQTGQTYVGPRITYNFDYEEVAIGGQFGLPLTSALDFYPSLDIFLVDEGSLLGFNGDLKFRPGMAGTSPLFVGGGLNLSRRSINDRSDTEPGLNLFGGLEGRSGSIRPFVEMRAILADRSTVQLSGGLNFVIGTR